MAESAASKVILTGSSGLPSGFERVERPPSPFAREQKYFDHELKRIADSTVPFRLKPFGKSGPEGAALGVVLGLRGLRSDLRANHVAYRNPDGTLGIAYPHVNLELPSRLGAERRTDLKLNTENIKSAFMEYQLVDFAKKSLESGKPVNKQWLMTTFGTDTAEGLDEKLKELDTAFLARSRDVVQNLAFGRVSDRSGSVEAINATMKTTAAHTRTEVQQEVGTQVMQSEGTRVSRPLAIGLLVAVGAPAVSGCTQEIINIATPTVIPVTPGEPTVPPTDIPPTLTPSGPETTPNAAHPYPASLSVETANAGMAAVEDAPASITGLPDVQTIVAKHTQLARDAGLAFDHMAVQYVPAEQRWFLVPVAADGAIAGWLQIADPTSQSGFRYGEQPTWDSNYSPRTDTYHYGLPALHDPANHFAVGFANGFPVLIEVTETGSPQYWNDVVEKTTMLVEGAVIPTEVAIELGNTVPYQVEVAPDLSNLPAALAPYREKLLQAGNIVNLYPPGGIEHGNPNIPGEYIELHFYSSDNGIRSLIDNTIYIQLSVKDPGTGITTSYDGMYGLFSRQGKTDPVDLLFLEQQGVATIHNPGSIAKLRTEGYKYVVFDIDVSIPPAGKEVKTAAACAGDPQPVVCRFGTNPVGDSLPVFFSTASDESSPVVVANLLQEFNELFGEGKRPIVIAALGGQ